MLIIIRQFEFLLTLDTCNVLAVDIRGVSSKALTYRPLAAGAVLIGQI